MVVFLVVKMGNSKMVANVKLKTKGLFGSRAMDLTKGPILSTLIKFSIPIILASLLSHLYGTVDSLMLALFVSDEAVGSVGATNAIRNAITSLFSGLGVGVSIVMGKCVGAKDKKNATETASTSMLLGMFGGTAVALIALFFTRPFLVLMGTPQGLLEDAILYMVVVSLGSPITLTTGFLGGILRASGDTKSPFLHSSIGGLLNVVFNAFFIIVLRMQVLGVALATILSQSVVLVLQFFKVFKERELYHVTIKTLRIYRDKLAKIAIFGIPSGINSMLTGLSHVVVQGTVNTFGEIGATGSSVANQIDYVGVFSGGVNSAASVFFSQNLGAKKMDRFKKVLKTAILLNVVLTTSLSLLTILFARPLLGIFSSDPKVIEYAVVKIIMLVSSYVVLETHNILASAVRVLGKPIVSMMVAITCSVLFKVVWLLTIYHLLPTPYMLYACYPISRVLFLMVILPICISVFKKKQKQINKELLQDNKV